MTTTWNWTPHLFPLVSPYSGHQPLIRRHQVWSGKESNYFQFLICCTVLNYHLALTNLGSENFLHPHFEEALNSLRSSFEAQQMKFMTQCLPSLTKRNLDLPPNGTQQKRTSVSTSSNSLLKAAAPRCQTCYRSSWRSRHSWLAFPHWILRT